MDGTMCPGRDCPKKEQCYRYTATPNEYRQAYFTTTQYTTENGEVVCNYFWRNNPYVQSV